MEGSKWQNNVDHRFGVTEGEPRTIVEVEGSFHIKIFLYHIMIDPCQKANGQPVLTNSVVCIDDKLTNYANDHYEDENAQL